MLVPARNPVAMAEAIQTLAVRPDRRLHMGVESRQVVERQFTIDRMVEQYAQAYRQLAG
jgi:glycosyltransferase involved in cell wall biosynthesis